jgi:hypothetical protein
MNRTPALGWSGLLHCLAPDKPYMTRALFIWHIISDVILLHTAILWRFSSHYFLLESLYLTIDACFTEKSIIYIYIFELSLLIDLFGVLIIERRSNLATLWTLVRGWLTGCWHIVFELCLPSIALFTCKVGLITLSMIFLLCWYAFISVYRILYSLKYFIRPFYDLLLTKSRLICNSVSQLSFIRPFYDLPLPCSKFSSSLV